MTRKLQKFFRCIFVPTWRKVNLEKERRELRSERLVKKLKWRKVMLKNIKMEYRDNEDNKVVANSALADLQKHQKSRSGVLKIRTVR